MPYTSNNRLYHIQIDIAKALSVFLVVSYHIPPLLSGIVSENLLLLRMPLFFFISGFLFKYEKYPLFLSFLKQRSKQILIPYISFFVLFYILWIFIGREFGDENDKIVASWQPILEFFRGDPHLVCAPTWFLIVLYVSQILYYFIFKYTQHNIIGRIFVCMALYLSHYFFFDYLFILPFKIVIVFKFLIFYALGNSLKQFCIQYIFSRRYLISIFPIAVFFMCMLLIPVNDTNEGILNLTKSISLIIITLLLCNLQNNNYIKKIAHYYSHNAIIILCIQNYLIGVIKIGSDKLFDYNLELLPYDPVMHILLSTLVFILFIPIITIINSYFPFLIGRQYKQKNN